jgi:LacI family transcriptional regulator
MISRATRQTIKEVAVRAGVSVGTVSNVLNGAAPVSVELRERVLKVIADLNYHPNHTARSLKSNRTKMIGMVISDIVNPFFPLLVRGAEDAALQHNYLLVTFNSDSQVDRERNLFHVLSRYRMDGILLVIASENDLEHVRRAVDGGTPIVFLDRVPAGFSCDSVSIDNFNGARQCVEHLIQVGHRRIGIIGGSPDLHLAQERLRGYRVALEAAGLAVDPDLITWGYFNPESARKAADALLRLPERPTALFAANNVMALGALHVMHSRGLRCPEDVAIGSFDDLPLFESLSPALTGVAQPSYDIGYQGAELLTQRLGGELGDPVHIVLPTQLRIRASSLPSGRGIARGLPTVG